MIVATFKDLYNDEHYPDTPENKMEKFIRSYPAFQKLNFGSWLTPKQCKDGEKGKHWFNFVNIHAPKGKIYFLVLFSDF